MRLLIGIVALFSATIAAIVFVILPMLLDEERLEQRVRDAVMAWSGQELATEGDLDVALFPQSLLTLYRPRIGGPDVGAEFAADRLDARVGMRYRQTVLQNGGQVAPADLVQRFLGRPTDSRAFFEALAR